MLPGTAPRRLRENVAWSQHSLTSCRLRRTAALRAARSRSSRAARWLAPIRDPAMFRCWARLFRPFAYTPSECGDATRGSQPLPNRRSSCGAGAFRLPLTIPLAKGSPTSPQTAPGAVARASPHRWIGRSACSTRAVPVSPRRGGWLLDRTADRSEPCPSHPRARLTSGSPPAMAEAYVQVSFYDARPCRTRASRLATGLHCSSPSLLVPMLEPRRARGIALLFRGDNLCPVTVLRRRCAMADRMTVMVLLVIVIPPRPGRVADIDADVLGFAPHIDISFTYGAAGPVGAHPSPGHLPDEPDFEGGRGTLARHYAAGGPRTSTLYAAVGVEIDDSLCLSGHRGAAGYQHRRGSRAPGPSSPSGRGRSRRSCVSRGPCPPARRRGRRDDMPRRAPRRAVLAPDEGATPGGRLITRPPSRARVMAAVCPGVMLVATAAGADLRAALENDTLRERADIQAFVPTPDVIVQRPSPAPCDHDRYHLDIADSIVDAGGRQCAAEALRVGAAHDPSPLGRALTSGLTASACSRRRQSAARWIFTRLRGAR